MGQERKLARARARKSDSKAPVSQALARLTEIAGMAGGLQGQMDGLQEILQDLEQSKTALHDALDIVGGLRSELVKQRAVFLRMLQGISTDELPKLMATELKLREQFDLVQEQTPTLHEALQVFLQVGT